MLIEAPPPLSAIAEHPPRAEAEAEASAEALASSLHGSCRLMRLVRPVLETEPGPRHDMVRLLHVPAPGVEDGKRLGTVVMPACDSLALFLYDDTTVTLSPSTLMLVINVVTGETRVAPACPARLAAFLVRTCALLLDALRHDGNDGHDGNDRHDGNRVVRRVRRGRRPPSPLADARLLGATA